MSNTPPPRRSTRPQILNPSPPPPQPRLAQSEPTQLAPIQAQPLQSQQIRPHTHSRTTQLATLEPSPVQMAPPATFSSLSPSKKRKASEMTPSSPVTSRGEASEVKTTSDETVPSLPASSPPSAKKSRTNTPWTAAEERRLKELRDAGKTWNEIAQTFPTRTEGSVKKHWYKDMHYADFAENESAALLAAIMEYESNKWKVIGTKLGKPAKACEQYAKEHFAGKT